MEKTYLLIYQYKDDSLKDSAYISIEKWDDELPISDWNECFENKDKILLKYYSNIPFNLVLEQFGNDNIFISCKTCFYYEDLEKIQLKDIHIIFDDLHNLNYYDDLVKKITNNQINYNKTFNIK